jgi:hypothetical protein
MNRLMLSCFVVLGLFCKFGIAGAATWAATTPAAPAVSSPNSSVSRTEDLPEAIAKLEGDVQTLQVEVRNLQGLLGQDPEDPQAIFSAAPLPNHDGAPIPNGDYSPGW